MELSNFKETNNGEKTKLFDQQSPKNNIINITSIYSRNPNQNTQTFGAVTNLTSRFMQLKQISIEKEGINRFKPKSNLFNQNTNN